MCQHTNLRLPLISTERLKCKLIHARVCVEERGRDPPALGTSRREVSKEEINVCISNRVLLSPGPCVGALVFNGVF